MQPKIGAPVHAEEITEIPHQHRDRLRLLYEVSGVGAEHQHFAVGHVDHANDPECYGQAQGGEDENRGETETVQQRFSELGAVHRQLSQKSRPEKSRKRSGASGSDWARWQKRESKWTSSGFRPPFHV